jgi:TRAP-type C4-dicarboxylate transport system permease small subunit
MMATVFIATLATGITALYLKFKTEHARWIDFMLKILIIYIGLFVNSYSSNILRFFGGSIVADIYGTFNDWNLTIMLMSSQLMAIIIITLLARQIHNYGTKHSVTGLIHTIESTTLRHLNYDSKK